MRIIIEPKILVEKLKRKSKDLARVFMERISEIFEVDKELNDKLYKGIYIVICEAIYNFLVHGKPDITRARIKLSMKKKNAKLIFSPKIIISDGINSISHDIEAELPLKISFAEDALVYKDASEDNITIDDLPRLMVFLNAYAKYLGISGDNDRKRIELLAKILLKKSVVTLADLVSITRSLSKRILEGKELKSFSIPLFKGKVIKELEGFEYPRRSPIRDMELKLKKITERS